MAMVEVTKERWLSLLEPGDIGLTCSRNLFATLQNWYRKKFKEGPERASHGLVIAEPPEIVESNGLHPSYGKIIKNIGDTTKVWVFRHPGMTPVKWALMEAYANGFIQGGGHYSVGGIVQFGLQFFGIRKRLTDAKGQFCTEFSGNMIITAGLPYITDRKAWEITPTDQLNWFVGPAQDVGWISALSYDGNGHYWANEEILSQELKAA